MPVTKKTLLPLLHFLQDAFQLGPEGDVPQFVQLKVLHVLPLGLPVPLWILQNALWLKSWVEQNRIVQWKFAKKPAPVPL